VDDLPTLAFDHAEIIGAAVQRVRGKSGYSTLPCFLLPEQFSITQLQQAYEQVSGAPLNKAAFRRKLAELDFIEAVPGAMLTGRRRPTQMYRIRADKRLALFDKAF
jgi:8-oxo-dGTP diphosphatase